MENKDEGKTGAILTTPARKDRMIRNDNSCSCGVTIGDDSDDDKK